MKRFFRIVICFVTSGILLFLSGYGNVMNDIEPSLAATTFIGMTVLFSVIFTLLWEIHIGNKEKIEKLSKEVDFLKEEIKKEKPQKD